jgi:dihydroorotate dehydrogenase (fumarate)
VVPHIELSTSAELLLRLRWIAILHGRIRAGLVATGGVARPADGVKAILAGAHATQMVSAILRHGPVYFRLMRDGLARWMESHRFAKLDEVRGRLSLVSSTDPGAFERANYLRTLGSWTRFDAIS